MRTTEEAVATAVKFHAKHFGLKENEYDIVGETMQWDGKIYDVFADKFIEEAV